MLGSEPHPGSILPALEVDSRFSQVNLHFVCSKTFGIAVEVDNQGKAETSFLRVWVRGGRIQELRILK